MVAKFVVTSDLLLSFLKVAAGATHTHTAEPMNSLTEASPSPTPARGGATSPSHKRARDEVASPSPKRARGEASSSSNAASSDAPIPTQVVGPAAPAANPQGLRFPNVDMIPVAATGILCVSATAAWMHGVPAQDIASVGKQVATLFKGTWALYNAIQTWNLVEVVVAGVEVAESIGELREVSKRCHVLFPKTGVALRAKKRSMCPSTNSACRGAIGKGGRMRCTSCGRFCATRG